MFVLTFGEEIFKISARRRLAVFFAGAVQLNIRLRRKAMKLAHVLDDDDAGVPIRGPKGKGIGSFCLVDTKPREFSAKQIGQLKKFAAIGEAEILR